jgi:hypothetical protein
MPARGNDIVVGAFDDGKPIVLADKHRLEHMVILGQTGTGKSRYGQGIVRQDIRCWPRSRCGMVVIDPHGEMFDGIMAWIAANKLTSLPIVPIDFRRDDQIVSYNPLRQRRAAPSVIIDNLVQAISYVFGQAGTDETPLLERWATNTLFRLYNEQKTLAEAAHLFTPEGLVQLDEIEDPMIRRDWLWARRNVKDFEIVTSSSINRFRRFVLNPTLRAIFGQSDVSLDLGRALDEGQIILVSLARNGGHLSRENADLFATLLLADLQVAADERGKGEHVKPFYVFVDEFWRFLTPTMADNLAEARGFGIAMTMATQHPRQILNSGRFGPRIYDEVMENARSKVVFRLRTRANLEPIAETLFMDTFDPEQVKYQHHSIKVVGQQVGYLPSFGQGLTNTRGGGEQTSRTLGKSHASGTNWGHSMRRSRSSTRSHVETSGDTYSDGDQWADSESQNWQNFAAFGNPDSVGRSQSGGGSAGHASMSTSADGYTESESEDEADSYGGSEVDTASEADTRGQDRNWTHGISQNVMISPVLFSVFSDELDQPMFRSIDEQIFIAMAKIARLKNREAYVLVGDMEVPVRIRTPDVNPPDISRACTEACTGWYQQESGLALPLADALERVAERDRAFYVVTVVSPADEIDRPRRRIVAIRVGHKNQPEIGA